MTATKTASSTDTAGAKKNATAPAAKAPAGADRPAEAR